MIVVGVLRWGPDGYQTWKFTTSAFSIVLVLVLVVAIGRSQILTLLLTAILGATISWSAYVWKDSQETAWVNPDLVSLTKEATALELKGVNILLSPFFETMAASVIAGRQAHMASPSYQFPSGQPLHYQCTITTKTRLGELPAGNDIIREHGNYVLAGSTRCLDPHKTTDP
jgi:hypothetical protein